jgi:hypothetical protein
MDERGRVNHELQRAIQLFVRLAVHQVVEEQLNQLDEAHMSQQG